MTFPPENEMQDVRVSADPPDLLGRADHSQADLPPRHRLRLIFLHRGEGVNIKMVTNQIYIW